MSSASPENADEVFVGVDPDDTKAVLHRGATFTLGVLPAGLWDIFSTKASYAFDAARRRTLAMLAARGDDPEEKLHGSELPRWWGDAAGDADYRKAKLVIQEDALRYGLRGHSNFFMGQNKKEVPFKTVQVNVEGVPTDVVAPETMRVYRANQGLMDKLYLELQALNQLSYVAKKA